MTNTRPTLMLVDDEDRILRSLAMLFRAQYNVLTFTDPTQALAHFEQGERVHVIVSDQRMPQMRGADLLRQVRDKSPNTMRLLLTGYSELDAVVASVNEGEIFRFLNKPWDAHDVRSTVQQAAEISLQLFGAGSKAPPQPLLTDTGRFVAPSDEAILIIDDDIEIGRAVSEIVGASVTVHWASSVDRALELLSQHAISVIVSELSVRGESVTALLKLLKAQHPEVVTIVLTPFQDVTVFIGLINQGQVYRLLPKPLRRGPLSMSLASALRHHRTLKHAPSLTRVHAVESLRAPEDITVANRVTGMLSRIRTRLAASA